VNHKKSTLTNLHKIKLQVVWYQHLHQQVQAIKTEKKVTKIRKEYKYADGQTKVEEQEITENI